MFLHAILLPVLRWLFAVVNPALDETISIHNAKLSTALMYYYAHYGIFSLRLNFLSQVLCNLYCIYLFVLLLQYQLNHFVSPVPSIVLDTEWTLN